MAKDSILVGAVTGSPAVVKGTKATNPGTADGEKGYSPRVGGRFPEKIRETSAGGRQLEKQTPPRSRKG